LHEKEIGSWFSLASPIKTTAGFSIKSELRLFRYPAPSCHLDQRERSQCNAGDLDEEKSLPTNYTNFHEKEIGSWFSLASPIKTTAGFWIKIELG
jgi:hypothetical protein